MTLEAIRDPHNRLMGYITTDDNGNGTARDVYMRYVRVLGRYNAERDFAYDAHNRPFGQSNQLAVLVYRSAQ